MLTGKTAKTCAKPGPTSAFDTIPAVEAELNPPSAKHDDEQIASDAPAADRCKRRAKRGPSDVPLLLKEPTQRRPIVASMALKGASTVGPNRVVLSSVSFEWQEKNEWQYKFCDIKFCDIKFCEYRKSICFLAA